MEGDRSPRYQGAAYERRTKARTDQRAVPAPEIAPVVEEQRAAITPNRKVKRTVRRGPRPPRAITPPYEAPEEIPQSHPQTAHVPRGGTLPPRRERVQGSSSSAPSNVQAQENVQVQEEIGPLRLTRPSRSNDHPSV
jgi:hypothetical protein